RVIDRLCRNCRQFMFGFLKRRKLHRRESLRAQRFSAEWRQTLVKRFPLFNRFPQTDQRELEGHIQGFFGEKNFWGCDGFQVTDEVKVLIAAQACLLLLHRQTDYYPRLRTILIYPDTYVAKTRWHERDEDTGRDARTRLGESWHRGVVVLAWSSTVA